MNLHQANLYTVQKESAHVGCSFRRPGRLPAGIRPGHCLTPQLGMLVGVPRSFPRLPNACLGLNSAPSLYGAFGLGLHAFELLQDST